MPARVDLQGARQPVSGQRSWLIKFAHLDRLRSRAEGKQDRAVRRGLALGPADNLDFVDRVLEVDGDEDVGEDS